ncbi:MAG: hypothetical protein H0V81_02770 [Solirubrobacterales bacterium]|nr:hypothetical protein [Solirubrobacterales bacterium]
MLKDVAALLVPGIADGCLVDVFSDQREAPPRRVALAGVRPGLDAVPTGLPTLEFVTDAALGLLAGNELEHAALRALGLRSLLVVALRPPGRTLGWLTLIHDDTSGRRFDAGDAQFADDLGRRIGAALAQPVA